MRPIRKFTLLFLLALPLSNIFGVSKVNAAIIEKEYDRTYEVKNDYVQVTERKEINITQNSYFIDAGTQDGFTIFNPIESDPNKEEKLQKTQESISLKDKNGKNLEYTVEETSNGNLVIKATINQTITPQNNFEMNLSYKSYGLVVLSGIVRDLYIPAFADNYVFEDSDQKETVTTKVIVPKEYGNINFTRPISSVKSDGQFHVIDINQQDLIGQTGWIQIGTKQIYEFSIKQPYYPSTSIPLVFNRYKIVIPRDIKSGPITQKVRYTRISPTPASVYTDENGNLIADFKVPAVDSGEIVIEGYAEVNQNNSIDFKTSGLISDIPSEIKTENTKDALYWEVNSKEIQDTAKEIVKNETNVYKAVESIYKYVVAQIDYSEVKKFGINQRQGALNTLKGGAAVCMEYSDLFIALVRAAGIPARAAFGSGYSSLEDSDASDNAINHQWAEVYIPSLKEWIAVDTTWGENGDILIGGDLNHFYSHISSVDPETPSTTQAVFYGQDNRLEDRSMIVKAVESFSTEPTDDQEDLLSKYPEESTNVINDIGSGASLFFRKLDENATTLLRNLGLPEQYLTLIKYALVVFILIIVLVLAISNVARRRKKRIEIAKLQAIANAEQ